jgi:hypothetical protein
MNRDLSTETSALVIWAGIAMIAMGECVFGGNGPFLFWPFGVTSPRL